VFDVAILGGGPAGCAAAIALRRLGVPRVLVAEASASASVRIGESIPPDTRLVLERLGIWEPFLEEKHEPCLGSCSSWGSEDLGFNDFLFNPHGTGWHLDRARFDVFLARHAEACGATLWRDARYESSRGGRLQFRDGREAAAGFVIDATGLAARYARQQGARRVMLDRLSCVAGFFAAPDFGSHTMLEAVEYGWWYAARIPGGRVAVAVATDAATLKSAHLHTRNGWFVGLASTRHLSGKLRMSRPVLEAPIVRTAPSFRLQEPVGKKWLAVGDAASAFDPISAQGIYKALVTGIEAAGAIATGSLGTYAASVGSRWEDYLRNRAYFYEAEGRWAGAPFWTARRTAKHLVGSQNLIAAQDRVT
jgi:flavin-dependent dehydrogenase